MPTPGLLRDTPSEASSAVDCVERRSGVRESTRRVGIPASTPSCCWRWRASSGREADRMIRGVWPIVRARTTPASARMAGLASVSAPPGNERLDRLEGAMGLTFIIKTSVFNATGRVVGLAGAKRRGRLGWRDALIYEALPRPHSGVGRVVIGKKLSLRANNPLGKQMPRETGPKRRMHGPNVCSDDWCTSAPTCEAFTTPGRFIMGVMRRPDGKSGTSRTRSLSFHARAPLALAFIKNESAARAADDGVAHYARRGRPEHDL